MTPYHHEDELDEIDRADAVQSWSQEQLRHMALDFALRTHTQGGNADADMVLQSAGKYLDFLAGNEAAK